MAQKPSIPKGTRDFSPIEMARRNYIFDTIRESFIRFGFEAIETPAMENLSSLLGKYGDEGDKLLFKILNSGNYLSKIGDTELLPENSKQLSTLICEKGLRYDLTVPFARYVVQHRNDITFPFKRYQIQAVWRADRPQKGRYREFFQCDVDVIGSTSLLNEVELIQIVDDVFRKLNISATIKINNRKILAAIAEKIGYPEKLTDITVAMDKLDKIGLEKVHEELLSKGISEDSLEMLDVFMNLQGNSNDEKMGCLRELIGNSSIGSIGMSELDKVFSYLKDMDIKNKVELDLNLARGLSYYTGAIIEVVANDVSIGSICGGGRYDDLTGIFGLKDVSGVGVSFGADRIYDVLLQLDLFPGESMVSTQAMFVNFGEKEEEYCLPLLAKLRAAGINSEIYPENTKMKKQMTYANNKNIPFVLLAGENEIKEGKLTVKNMKSSEQSLINIDEFIDLIK